MANLITSLRILCAAAILFFPALSPAFYLLYSIAGLSDMIDGAVARKTNTVSAFGAALDTVADLALVAACLFKLIPVLALPKWFLIWIAVIALIKSVNLTSGFVMRKRFVALHTTMNKVTGALLFALPLTLSVLDVRISGAAVCAIAAFAAIQEGHLIRTGRDA